MSDHDCLKRSRIRFSKEPVFVFNSQFDVDTHFRQNPFKTILTHSNKPTKCTVIHDQNMPAHQMSIRYRLCVSSKCQEADPTDDEKCPYKAYQFPEMSQISNIVRRLADKSKKKGDEQIAELLEFIRHNSLHDDLTDEDFFMFGCNVFILIVVIIRFILLI
jgi:hypothetical protein